VTQYVDPKPLFAMNAPPWLCITSPDYAARGVSHGYREETPEHEAARLAAAEASHLTRLERDEIARKARDAKNEAMKVMNAQLRREQSERRRAAKEAEKAANRRSPEVIRAIHIAVLAKATAAKRAKNGQKVINGPQKRVRAHPVNLNKIAPAGFTLECQAAAVAGCRSATVSTYVQTGQIGCVRQGKYVFVRIDEVRACMAKNQASKAHFAHETMKKAREAQADKRKSKAMAQLSPHAGWATDPARPRLVKRKKVEA
jgi:hypothetical protein